MENSNAQVSPPQQQQDHQHVRLACQACQKKKIKCDRNLPCGQCHRSNLQCVPSTRKPRARHVGKRAIDSELRSRITKLESLVESLSGEVGAGVQDVAEHDDAPNHSDTGPKGNVADEASPAVGRYIGSPFWSSLIIEVQSLRDALEEDQAEEEAAEEQSPTTSSSGANNGNANSNDYDLIICPPGAVYVMPGALNEPSPQVAAQLYGVFVENVAPLFKEFHIPTLRPFLERGAPYLGLDANAVPNKALKASLWYAAVSSLTESQCRAQFGTPKAELSQRYRRCVDVLLSQADLMNTRDMATLEALVTYIIASRVLEANRRPWSLAALAVRIARAMGLHHETPGLHSPFHTELRRRAWDHIRFLDAFTGVDRGTEPLIATGSFDTPMPCNLNDGDFDENSASIIPRENCITDMSFSIMAYEATDLTQRLNTPEFSPKGDSWQQRLELAQSFGKRMQAMHFQYCEPSNPFHRLILAVGNSMCCGMVLRAVRPMQKHLSSVPPRVDNPYVLQIAIDSLRSSERIHEDPEAHRWLWMVWVQWHALAVALAGLCSIRGTELSEEAWIYVDKAYERHAAHVADTRHGMLWRPIQKLYKTAVAFRDEGRQQSRTPRNLLASPSMSIGAAPLDLRVGIGHPISTSNPTTSTATTNHNAPTPRGGVPMDPILTGPMDFGISSTMSVEHDLTTLTGTALQPGDISWHDWERIMDDLSTMDTTLDTTGNIALADLQMMPTWQAGPGRSNEAWPSSLRQNSV